MQRFDLLNRVIAEMDYTSFCEIGYQNGTTHGQISCEEKVAIDPAPVKMWPGHTVLQMTSDAYFANASRPYDLYFVDGDHSCHQVYRDTLNCLNYLEARGCIVLHDVCPLYEHLTVPHGCGDAYKAFMQLRSERDDLCMFVCDEWNANDETGYGVIFPGRQRKWEDPIEYTFKYMNDHREELMCVKPTEEIIQLLKGRK